MSSVSSVHQPGPLLHHVILCIYIYILIVSIYHIIHTIHIASHHHINIEYFAQSNFTARPSGPSLGRARAVTEALVDVNGMKIDMSTVSLQRLDFLLTDLGRIC